MINSNFFILMTLGLISSWYLSGTIKDSEKYGTFDIKIYPNKSLTIGDIRLNAGNEVCKKSTKEFRDVSTIIKKKVIESYGISYPLPKGQYEIDHFIPLALGGSNAEKNLWPQPKKVRICKKKNCKNLGFSEKDKVEFYLYKQVCSNKLPLDTAQEMIRNDWVWVYENFIENKFGALKDDYKKFEKCEEGCP